MEVYLKTLSVKAKEASTNLSVQPQGLLHGFPFGDEVGWANIKVEQQQKKSNRKKKIGGESKAKQNKTQHNIKKEVKEKEKQLGKSQRQPKKGVGWGKENSWGKCISCCVRTRRKKKADRLFLVSGNDKRLGRSQFVSCFSQKLDKFIDCD